MNDNRLVSTSRKVVRVKPLQNFEMEEKIKKLYRTNPEYRKLLDDGIRAKLEADLYKEIFDITEYLGYANKYISGLIEDKPYLIDRDVISGTLMDAIDNLKEKWLDSEDFAEKSRITQMQSRIIHLLAIYKAEFSNRFEIDYNKEIGLTLYYEEKKKSGEILSINELEELMNMYLSGCINYKQDEFLDYIFMNLIEMSYEKNDDSSYRRLDERLYRRIFLKKCESFLEKDNIKDLRVSIKYINNSKKHVSAKFIRSQNEIILNKEYFSSKEIIDNLVSFFHEKRHYEQSISKEVSVRQLSQAKDVFLEETLGKGYYYANYYDLTHEKDATYSSLKELFYYVMSAAPGRLHEVKRFIKFDLIDYNFRGSKDNSERIKKASLSEDLEEIENFSLLFERVVKRNKAEFLRKIATGDIPMVLLYEYDIKGNKKDLFELLAERDSLEDEPGNDRKKRLYNYLLNKEVVSLEYIFKNIILLNKNKGLMYYDDVKKIIREKIILYFMSFNQTRINESTRYSDTFMRDFFEKQLEKLKSKKVALDDDYGEFATREEELEHCFKELFIILNQPIEEPMKRTLGK